MNSKIEAVGDALRERLAAVLSDRWWVLLVRGLIAIAFGVIVYTQPGISLAMLVLLFGAFSLADGVLGVWTAFSSRKDHDNWWVLLLWGLVGIGIGIITFLAPGITALALLFYIAVWAIVIGVLQVIAAVRLRREIEGEWLLGLAGVISIAFGVLLLARPGAGALAVLWIISVYAVLTGILLILLAFKVKSFGRKLAAG
jgi:uncharacterized membrane protein HdeD (DUF308 family)